MKVNQEKFSKPKYREEKKNQRQKKQSSVLQYQAFQHNSNMYTRISRWRGERERDKMFLKK